MTLIADLCGRFSVQRFLKCILLKKFSVEGQRLRISQKIRRCNSVIAVESSFHFNLTQNILKVYFELYYEKCWEKKNHTSKINQI